MDGIKGPRNIEIEDGYSHPAERHIQHQLAHNPQMLADWIEKLLASRISHSRAALVIKCVGRVKDACQKLDPRVIKIALGHSSIEVRDSAAQTLEQWGTAQAKDLLKEYLTKEEVPWLRDYMERVVRDIENNERARE